MVEWEGRPEGWRRVAHREVRPTARTFTSSAGVNPRQRLHHLGDGECCVARRFVHIMRERPAYKFNENKKRLRVVARIALD
jgi:hypothetical protein